MINFYNYKNKVIVHNDNNSSWIVVSEKEAMILNKYFNKEINKIPNHLYKLLTVYQINMSNDNSIEKVISDPQPLVIPKIVYIVTTEKCNLSCSYCYAEANSLKALVNELTLNEYEKIFDDLVLNNVETVVFTGGEINEKKEIDSIIMAAYKRGLKCNIITNGSLLYSKKRALLYSQICNKITISLDSLDQIENDYNRGLGCYRFAKKAIDNLIELRFKNITINQTITKKNISAVEKLELFAKKNNIHLNTGVFCEMGRGKNIDSLSIDERKLVEIDSIRNKEILTPFTINIHCGQGIGEFSINPLGNVYTCKLLATPHFQLGNLRVNTLREVFEKNKDKLNIEKYSVYGNMKCKKCSFKLLCGGSCKASHYYANEGKDDTYVDDSECTVIKEMLKEHMYRYFEEV